MAVKFVLKHILPNTTEAESTALREYFFDADMFTVGSDETNHFVLAGDAAPEQMVVIREGDFLTLINRAEGTRLNGETLRREAFAPLTAGDQIFIGNYLILVIDDELSAVLEVQDDEHNLSDPSDVNGNNENLDSNLSAEMMPAENQPEQSPATRNFADILDTLRTEEDSFYFVLTEPSREAERIPLEQPEIPVGINGKGRIVFGIEQTSTLYAVVRKDWSGILVESQRRNTVFVNGEAVEGRRRLRNDDRITFSLHPGSSSSALVLHEPSSLVALESLLSARISPNQARFGGLVSAKGEAAENIITAEKKKIPLMERKYFKYFSFIEILIMLIGTLIGAVLFFLLFEFLFS